jgi:hypothetical protein
VAQTSRARCDRRQLVVSRIFVAAEKKNGKEEKEKINKNIMYFMVSL